MISVTEISLPQTFCRGNALNPTRLRSGTTGMYVTLGPILGFAAE